MEGNPFDNPEGDPLKVTPGGLLRATGDIIAIGGKITWGVATVPFKIIGAVADAVFDDDGRHTMRGGGFRDGDWGRHR